MADKKENTDQLLEVHQNLLQDALQKNSERVVTTKHVIEQYENQKEFLLDLPKALTKPVLVPVGGSKGFFRGNLVHTNEVLHNIGCGYVVKRTVHQAVEVCDRMINETNKFLMKLYDEEKWLDGQIQVPLVENAFSNAGQVEIVETFDEKQEAEWRIKHRERVKAMKDEEKKARKKDDNLNNDIFNTLDVLELQEDIDEAQAALDVEDRKSKIQSELEQLRENKTKIKTEDDVLKRLDELEKEEMLLDEMEMLSASIDSDEVHPEDTKNETSNNIIVSEEKSTTIRFNEEVETKLYDSNKAVSDECDSEPVSNEQFVEDGAVYSLNASQENEDEKPVTLILQFSHSDCALTCEDSCGNDIIKPSDLYSMPYRPKSILKNKNRIFDEPQHSGEYSETMMHAPVKKTEKVKDRNWVCFDTFPKNGNDSDQENANVQVPALTEVKEKTGTSTPSPNPPISQKTRPSRFSVSRALITKK